jgi:hypothetical protein
MFVSTTRNVICVLTRKPRHIQGSLIHDQSWDHNLKALLTDGLLRTTVHKSFDGIPIYLDWDAAADEQMSENAMDNCVLEHGHPPEAFWRVFKGMLPILQDGLLTYRFFNLPLGLHVEGIGIETLDFR